MVRCVSSNGERTGSSFPIVRLLNDTCCRVLPAVVVVVVQADERACHIRSGKHVPVSTPLLLL
jgi:hypothetical protein